MTALVTLLMLAAADPSADGDSEPLDERLARIEEELRQTRELTLNRRPTVTVGGYADLGFFVTEGDGSGVQQDLGPAESRRFPEYIDRFGWVFLGDLLAPAVNSRGEPADLGDLPGTDRWDGIDSNGAPGFIVNEVNLRLTSRVAESALATVSLDFLPRTGSDFRLGDAFEVDLAQLEWMLGAARRASIFVGKIEPVIGIEYRERKTDRRFGITPSLVARYTTGTPLGLKVRSKFGPRDLLVAAAAVTNGSSVIEPFHFHDETDSNAGKTVSGRISVTPALPFELEAGLSGIWGPQDRALDSRGSLWFWGVDVRARIATVEIKGEWLRGRGAGEANRRYADAHRPYGLDLDGGGYLSVEGMVTPVFGLIVRGEFRDARVWLGNPTAPEGADRIYVTQSWRATIGARAVLSDRLVLKAEFLKNGEYGRVPSIRNDVFTTSLSMMF